MVGQVFIFDQRMSILAPFSRIRSLSLASKFVTAMAVRVLLSIHVPRINSVRHLEFDTSWASDVWRCRSADEIDT
jgi:hypothetical protein